MPGHRKKPPREKDLTSRYFSGDFDPAKADDEGNDAPSTEERFGKRSKFAQENKTARTALMRAEGPSDSSDLDTLPTGQVFQVYSLFCEVLHGGQLHLCVVRKTLTKTIGSQLVVGDEVRIRPTGSTDDQGRPEAVVEQVLPRRTVLTRADSFKGIAQHPIVANADQMLIVASVASPGVKWGLVDRMIVAARSGGLVPVVCLNKIDLGAAVARPGAAEDEAVPADEALSHYASMGIFTLRTSVQNQIGLDDLRARLENKITVLSGHSGVGKSSLIRGIQPALDLRVGEVSIATNKGRHTTTSARWYGLDFGGAVIDTPGVKLFGLWGVQPENLIEFFPDVTGGNAPQWRAQSYERILASLRS